MTELSQRKQPIQLYILFFTEMWERYGFYTMRGILVLYMTKILLFSNNHSYAIFGAFTALIYLTPSAGGYIADQLLGFRRAIMGGAVILAIGYALLAVPGTEFFYYGLSCIIIGNGFFKPNVSGIVGQLYERNDPRREGGFQIFYAGINIGGIIPPLVTAAVIALYGWHAVFIMASIGVLVGLAVFSIGFRKSALHGVVPEHTRSNKKNITLYAVLLIGTLLAIVGFRFLTQHTTVANYVLFSMGTLFFLFSITKSFAYDQKRRYRLWVCHILIVFSVIFWVLYQQGAMSLTIFTEFNLNRTFFGWTIPTVMFQALNPIAIIAFAPLCSWLWKFLDRYKMNPSIPVKFALGTILMGAGFAMMPLILMKTSSSGQISFWWVVLSYLLQSIGELLLSPVGLSMITELSPLAMVGLMMGAWFFASAVANALAGLASQWTTVAAGSNNPLITDPSYAHVFGILGWSSIAAGIIVLFFCPRLKRMIGRHKR